MSSFDLSSYAIGNCDIAQAYYVPDFITEAEEEYLLRQIYNAPKPKWKILENRRLQVWGGDLTTSNKLFAQPLPGFLTNYPDIIGRLKSTGAFSNSKHGAPNHVIINEYLPLQGIMPHEDGPSYHPVVATISLGSHTVFHYYRYKSEETLNTSSPNHAGLMGPKAHDSIGEPNKPTRDTCGTRGRVIDMTHPVLSLLLEPRSLVITTEALYTDHLHGIDPLAEDVFLPASVDSCLSEVIAEGSDEDASHTGVRVANWSGIKDPKLRDVVMKGGTLKREARISLTCRDVENVVTVQKSLR